MRVIKLLYPTWRDLSIHEAAPAGRGASLKLRAEAKGYVYSHYDLSIPFGALSESGYRNEDLERQTFADDSFDLVITQDVFEHLFDPLAAAKEISRTLKMGGAHIFSVPLVRRHHPSLRRAIKDSDGRVTHLAEPQYHANPISSEGSLVTIDWGFDILEFLGGVGTSNSIYYIDDLKHGIQAELNEIVVSRKSRLPKL